MKLLSHFFYILTFITYVIFFYFTKRCFTWNFYDEYNYLKRYYTMTFLKHLL